jgi:leader peptidase (prepilin peptidase)/N-methyltransferase
MTTGHDQDEQDVDGRDIVGRDLDERDVDDSALLPLAGGRRSRRAGRGPARIDVAAGVALLGLVAVLGPPVPGMIAASTLAVVTGALVRVDVAERRLPNALVLVVLVGAAAGVVVAVAGGDGASAAWACLLGLAVIAACVPLVCGGGLGAGDAKLASVGAVAAALASPAAPLAWLVAVALLGGVHGVAAVVIRRRGASPGRAVIPFGPVLLVGWWLAVVVAVLLDAA